MLIKVTVIPGTKKNSIALVAPDHYRVRVKAPPVKGQANKELISLLADYFNTTASSIVIKRGLHSRNKLIEIKE
ncbi:MAG: DUF167 domain-containing protein [candidate division WOR-3 bacterium]|nr:MAG: DUF167 domain-containing protein [candidate division WOR-3 bacterium]